ncbi:MAG: SIMPL domain-containing protein, partial [Deltaproteobacteria bacterium]|nr:SIMPL domain-containing protein [Deltaproteobacteria bacterium]
MQSNNNLCTGTLQAFGTGEVQAAPDEAVVELSVITEAPTAAAAVSSNAQRTQQVIAAVSAQPNHGVTTRGPYLYPIIRFDQNTQTSTIIGYRAINTVVVETKPSYAGQIFDAGVKAGANESSGITFRLQNDAPFREQALELAVEEAFSEARVVAQASGVQLDAPEHIYIEPVAR